MMLWCDFVIQVKATKTKWMSLSFDKNDANELYRQYCACETHMHTFVFSEAVSHPAFHCQWRIPWTCFWRSIHLQETTPWSSMATHDMRNICDVVTHLQLGLCPAFANPWPHFDSDDLQVRAISLSVTYTLKNDSDARVLMSWLWISIHDVSSLNQGVM